jgi:hypothetical protein
MLTTILASHPGPHGTIFDLLHNQSAAMELIQSRGIAGRVTFTTGNFFESIPSGYDLQMMSHVIHDWSEEKCLTILANCRRAMSPASRLLIVESVQPEGNTFHPGKMLDITMLALTPGEERTESEYRALLAQSNFKLNRVIPNSSAVSIVEAIPA